MCLQERLWLQNLVTICPSFALGNETLGYQLIPSGHKVFQFHILKILLNKNVFNDLLKHSLDFDPC